MCLQILLVAVQQFVHEDKFPCFLVMSRFCIFDCTSPYVENTCSTPALDTTAVSSEFHKKRGFVSGMYSARDNYQL